MSAVACSGRLGTGGSDSSGGNSTDSNNTSSNLMQATDTESNHLPELQVCMAPNTPAPRQLRRLTATELNNSLTDIFSDSNLPLSATLFENDPENYTFHNVSSMLVVDATSASQLQTMAEAMAPVIVSRDLAQLVNCNSLSSNCASELVSTLGYKMFRQPIGVADANNYEQLMLSQNSFSKGATLVVDAMIQSPYFLYRQELGTPNAQGLFQLNPYEIATELSYEFTGSTPDNTLMMAAQSNQLATLAQLQNQVQRLLTNPRAHATLDNFFLQWLGVYDLPNVSREQANTMLTPQIANSMVAEMQSTIDNLMFSQNGNFASMHAITSTFVDANLAAFYGLSGASGSGQSSVSIGSRAPGVLYLGGVLSASSETNLPSPVLRGRMLREHILCNTVPAPPANLAGAAVAPAGDNPNETTRQTYESHLSPNSVCATCHLEMDPMAFAQSQYDTIGRLFPDNMENGQAIQSNGLIMNVDNQEQVQLANAAALSSYIGSSPQAQACFARNWTMFALGMTDFAQDGCSFDATASQAMQTNYNLLGTLKSIVATPSFTTRVMDP